MVYFPIPAEIALLGLTLDAGLDLARLADLPQDVHDEASRVAKALEECNAKSKAQSKSEQIIAHRKALLKVWFLHSSLKVNP